MGCHVQRPQATSESSEEVKSTGSNCIPSIEIKPSDLGAAIYEQFGNLFTPITPEMSVVSSASSWTKHQMLFASRSPTEILPALFLGSQDDSFDVERLKELGVTHILSVMSGKQHIVPNCELLAVAMADNGTSDLDDVMKRTFDFIKESQHDGKKLLVHCKLGQSRSATIVIAWLMTSRKTSLHDAYVFVKMKRALIQPHSSYIQELRKLDKLIHGVYSVPSDFIAYSFDDDGKMNIAHENWTPEQSIKYRNSQADCYTGKDYKLSSPYFSRRLSRPSSTLDVPPQRWSVSNSSHLMTILIERV